MSLTISSCTCGSTAYFLGSPLMLSVNSAAGDTCVVGEGALVLYCQGCARQVVYAEAQYTITPRVVGTPDTLGSLPSAPEGAWPEGAWPPPLVLSPPPRDTAPPQGWREHPRKVQPLPHLIRGPLGQMHASEERLRALIADPDLPQGVDHMYTLWETPYSWETPDSAASIGLTHLRVSTVVDATGTALPSDLDEEMLLTAFMFNWTTDGVGVRVMAMCHPTTLEFTWMHEGGCSEEQLVARVAALLDTAQITPAHRNSNRVEVD